VVDMGGFYLDVIKDRLYTTPAHGLPRRSAQTAMQHVLEAMVRWLAPILSFTAEEIWQFLPGAREESVFLATWWQLPDVHPTAGVDWDAVLALKSEVSGELERLRAAGAIGAPLEAEVDIYVDAAQRARLEGLGDELRFVLITSEARLLDASQRPADAAAAVEVAKEGAWIAVRALGHAKCARCWHRRPDIGEDARHPELCGRCVSNLEGPGETRSFA
jgi:isoleucyl-tRNA synthetase